jgi:hypothetical protein
MVAVNCAPIVCAPLILVNADPFHGTIETGTACDVQVLTTIGGDTALHGRKLSVGRLITERASSGLRLTTAKCYDHTGDDHECNR